MLEFRCDECDRGFDSAADLLVHFSRHALLELYQKTVRKKSHLRGKTRVCSRSKKQAAGEVNPIKLCTVTMGNKPKQNTYPDCFKHFDCPTNLKKHMLICTDGRSLTCTFCNLTFSRNYMLKQHQKKCHVENIGDKSETKGSRKQDKSQIVHNTSDNTTVYKRLNISSH